MGHYQGRNTNGPVIMPPVVCAPASPIVMPEPQPLRGPASFGEHTMLAASFTVPAGSLASVHYQLNLANGGSQQSVTPTAIGSNLVELSAFSQSDGLGIGIRKTGSRADGSAIFEVIAPSYHDGRSLSSAEVTIAIGGNVQTLLLQAPEKREPESPVEPEPLQPDGAAPGELGLFPKPQIPEGEMPSAEAPSRERNLDMSPQGPAEPERSPEAERGEPERAQNEKADRHQEILKEWALSPEKRMRLTQLLDYFDNVLPPGSFQAFHKEVGGSDYCFLAVRPSPNARWGTLLAAHDADGGLQPGWITLDYWNENNWSDVENIKERLSIGDDGKLQVSQRLKSSEGELYNGKYSFEVNAAPNTTLRWQTSDDSFHPASGPSLRQQHRFALEHLLISKAEAICLQQPLIADFYNATADGLRDKAFFSTGVSAEAEEYSEHPQDQRLVSNMLSLTATLAHHAVYEGDIRYWTYSRDLSDAKKEIVWEIHLFDDTELTIEMNPAEPGVVHITRPGNPRQRMTLAGATPEKLQAKIASLVETQPPPVD